MCCRHLSWDACPRVQLIHFYILSQCGPDSRNAAFFQYFIVAVFIRLCDLVGLVITSLDRSSSHTNPLLSVVKHLLSDRELSSTTRSYFQMETTSLLQTLYIFSRTVGSAL